MTQYTLAYLPNRNTYAISTGERIIEVIYKAEDETPDSFKERAISRFDIFISATKQLLGNPIIIKTELA